MISPSGENSISARGFNHNGIVSGDLNDGIYETSVAINQHSENGEWTIGDFWLYDKAGNGNWLKQEDLNELGIVSTLNLSGVTEDTLAPELKQLTIDNYDIDLSKGDATQRPLQISYNLSDLVMLDLTG